jgi:hypothetical protein
MAIIKGKNCSASYDGTILAQIISLDWDGLENPVETVRYIGSSSVQKSQSDVPDFGAVKFNADADPTDAGNIKLDTAFRASDSTKVLVLTVMAGGVSKTYTGAVAVTSMSPLVGVQAGSTAKFNYTLEFVGDVVLA